MVWQEKSKREQNLSWNVCSYRNLEIRWISTISNHTFIQATDQRLMIGHVICLDWSATNIHLLLFQILYSHCKNVDFECQYTKNTMQMQWTLIQNILLPSKIGFTLFQAYSKIKWC